MSRAFRPKFGRFHFFVSKKSAFNFLHSDADIFSLCWPKLNHLTVLSLKTENLKKLVDPAQKIIPLREMQLLIRGGSRLLSWGAGFQYKVEINSKSQLLLFFHSLWNASIVLRQ